MSESMVLQKAIKFALRIVGVYKYLSNERQEFVLSKQLLRSGTSVGANYRAACRAKSTADLLHKLSIVEEEADESLYWMELLIDAKIMPENKLAILMNDLNEIIAMIVASIRTMRSKKLVVPKSKI